MANGHGGPREGAGRPTAEFLEKARKIGDPLKVIEFYWDVATGKDMEQVVTDAGVSIATPAAVRDRLKAGELYLDRLIGKVPQVTELSGEGGSEFSAIPTAALEQIVAALASGTAGSSSSGTGKAERT